ncbi:MAG: hypothetical protein ABW321_35440 [Polyangiales bacterium]
MFRLLLGAWAVVLTASCASTPSAAGERDARERLRGAMHTPIDTRERRDEQSRLLEDNVAAAALEGLDQHRVRETFGPGQACQLELCRAQGFGPGDWYYEIVVSVDARVKQRPLLMIAFVPHGRVRRVFTLTRH